MTLAVSLTRLLQPQTNPAPARLSVTLAQTAADIRAAQRLRYQVFVEEMGARIDDIEQIAAGIEADGFDAYCDHLIVRDLDRDLVVGCYRILTDAQADVAGGYYSAGEFDIARVLALPGRVMEIGRSCVHPAYRSGATIGLLWQGLARYLVENRFDYLMGCASIPLGSGTAEALAVYERLKEDYLAPEQWRVFPRVPLPQMNLAGHESRPAIPALIRAYLRVGAKICGEPAWDPQFNVADLFILLRADQIDTRYARHFLKAA